MLTPDARDAGRSANRRGKARERMYAEWLAVAGIFPYATVTPVHGRQAGDLAAIGDRVCEVTIRPWDRLTEKLRQAEEHAHRAGLDQYFVWRHIKRAKDEPGTVPRDVVIWRAEVIWPLLARLDRLEAWEAEQTATAQDAWEAGYAAGYAARDGART